MNSSYPLLGILKYLKQRKKSKIVHVWIYTLRTGDHYKYQVIGRIQGEKVFGTNGRYVGTIVNDRLVYRSTQSATISSSFTSANRAGTARANRVGTAIWGEAPDIPD